MFSGRALWKRSKANTRLPFRGLPCRIEAKGEFEVDVTQINLDFEVEARFPGGHTGKVLTRNDDLCDWATIRQEGRLQCPSKKGSAVITTELMLASIFVPEVSYIEDIQQIAGMT